MSEPTRDPALAALEAALRALPPAPAGLDRDRLMFQAGQSRRPRTGWLWPAAAAALALLSVGLGTALMLHPAPEPVVQVVYVPAPSPDVSASPAGENDTPDGANYFRLRDQVLSRGLDSLPELPPAPPAPPRDSLDKLLN